MAYCKSEAFPCDSPVTRMNSLVSVIVPVFNCEKFIEKCLNSIISQSYAQIEVLVINDGSTDNSQKIINVIAQSDSRVHCLWQQNQGVAAARNYALGFAKGDYYLFVDGDDYIGTDYVKSLVECADRNHSELVICGYTLVYHNKQLQVIPDLYVKNEKEEWAYRISGVCSRLYSSRFWNRSLLRFVQENNARAEDVPPALFANAMAANIHVVKTSDYFYVQHAESAMHDKKIFLFPYEAFKNVYCGLKHQNLVNSRVFFDIGILKFLAQFEFVLYRKAGREERCRFHTYIDELLKDDISYMLQEWKSSKKCINFPLRHKLAISLFLTRYYARLK